MTEAGQRYFETSRRLLDELVEAERHVTGEYHAPKGGLVVSAPIVFGRLYLTPIIVEILKAYTEVRIELQLSDSISQMIDDHIDVVLRIGELPDSGFMAVKAGDVRHVVCASPAYLKKRGSPTHPSELETHDCVTFLAFGPANEWTFKLGNRVEKYRVNARLAVSTAEAAADATVAGIGITRLLCYQVSGAIAKGSLKVLLRDYEPKPLPVHLVYPAARLVPQKLRAFLDFVLPRLKAKLVFDPQ